MEPGSLTWVRPRSRPVLMPSSINVPSTSALYSIPVEVFDTFRLQALAAYEVLDTPPEPEFDDIVHIAQKICNTPVALVSLVDANRQWFKARVGFAVCETPLEQSVCAHALREDDFLIIPDLTVDPRTKGNRLVTGEPFIRFYAGVVLKTPEGQALGTLCVIDSKPRPDGLTREQADALSALGRQTMVVMGMRRAVQERAEALSQERAARLIAVDRAREVLADRERLHRDELRQRLAQEAGGIGTFEIDPATDRCFMSARFCRIFGMTVTAHDETSRWQDLVLAEDAHLLSTREGRLEGLAQRDIEFRIARENDGAVRWISRRTEFMTDDDGKAYRMFGVVQDVTERKLVEGRSGALIRLGDALREATKVHDVFAITGRVLGVTLAATRAGFCMIDLAGGVMTVDGDWTTAGVASIGGTYPLATFDNTIARLSDGAPVVIANLPSASWMRDDLTWFEAIGSKAKITVPLLDHGRLAGLVFVHDTEPRTWSTAEIDFVQAVADRAFAIIARIEAEERQRILNLELSHRLKNTLAMVQAIATQTLRGVEDKSAVRAFEDRLIALSRAHDVLLQENWTAARIDTVVANVLVLHGDGGRVSASGPQVPLGPKATLSLSLLLHELATNAAKYGALSRLEGRVSLAWTVEGSGKQGVLKMAWRESGGPEARAPTRRGFGSRLISMGLAGTGGAKLDYAESGLIAEFTAPMTAITEAS